MFKLSHTILLISTKEKRLGAIMAKSRLVSTKETFKKNEKTTNTQTGHMR